MDTLFLKLIPPRALAARPQCVLRAARHIPARSLSTALFMDTVASNRVPPYCPLWEIETLNGRAPGKLSNALSAFHELRIRQTCAEGRLPSPTTPERG